MDKLIVNITKENEKIKQCNKTLKAENTLLKARLQRCRGLAWNLGVSRDENAELKKVLENHGIFYRHNTSISVIRKPNPHLPLEVLRIILQFALIFPHPIIDPGVEFNPSKITEFEHAEQRHLPLQLLRVRKTFKTLGTEIFFQKNAFNFTQVSSLKWMVNAHPEVCAELKHLELRIVGVYYYDVDSDFKVPLYEDVHYDDIDSDQTVLHPGHVKGIEPQMDTTKRIPSLDLDWTGLQSYCWRQIYDFMNALHFPQEPGSSPRPREQRLAFKNLNSLMIDLVNFTGNLPGPGTSLRYLTRESLGPILQYLYVRGCPTDSNGKLAFECLEYLVKDGGLAGRHALARFMNRVGSKYLQEVRWEGIDESLWLHLKRNHQPECKGIENDKKYSWWVLPKLFDEFKGRGVEFHNGTGYPVALAEGGKNIKAFEIKMLDALMAKRIAGDFLEHDQDLSHDDVKGIYGPDSDLARGTAPMLHEGWESPYAQGPDARICANCKDFYGYIEGQEYHLERDGRDGAEAGFLRELAKYPNLPSPSPLR